MSTLNLTSSSRIVAIDVLRGMIMVVMALDHTRDYFHTDAFVFDPTDLTRTNTALFFTRWVTHFCMPAFVLLSGLSIRLSLLKRSLRDTSRFLLVRGGLLIALEILVMRFGYFFNFYFDVTILSVLWLFGVCMLAMALLIHLPKKLLWIVAMVILCFHDLSFLYAPAPGSVASAAWTILMRVGFIPLTPSTALIVSYPVIPWLSVMILGFCLGDLYLPEVSSSTRVKRLLIAGVIVTLGFVFLRLVNVYGDTPWQTQATPLYTVLSFLNTTKYPVSLLFLVMTLGPLLIMLGLIERYRVPEGVAVFGREPLFYFVVHFYLIHSAALAVHLWRSGVGLSEVDFHFEKSFGGITPAGGVSLIWVYVAWAAIVSLMYPLCRRYRSFKSKRTQAIWRFF